MLNAAKPVLRALKFRAMLARAQRRAARPSEFDESPPGPPPGFIVACGRSGTTLLGKIFRTHPEICYLFEPYHLWAAIEPRTDVTNLHVRVDGLFIMREGDATDETRRRFNRLIFGARRDSGKRLVVEKTPHNIARLGFLEALAPGASYIHIVRSGIDACRSIDRLARANAYRIAGRPRHNSWWGEDESKWKALARDGASAGYFPEEVGTLTGHDQRGAYEWLVSLGEADRFRDRLGPRLREITYPRLTGDAAGTIRALCEHLGASCPRDWLDAAAALVEDERRNPGAALILPRRMAGAFNAAMERYGFEGRATAVGGGER